MAIEDTGEKKDTVEVGVWKGKKKREKGCVLM